MERLIVETGAAAPEGGAGGELVNETQWGAIRALFERGLSRKQIARELGIDIKTVRKWLLQSWRRQRRRRRVRELDAHRAFLSARAPEVGFNAMVLYRELKCQGYTGSYAALARYVSAWRAGQRVATESTERFETEAGEQSQVDWGSSWVWLGGERVRVHVFVMVLGYSRRLYARGYLSEGVASLLDGHERAFAHFGGRTREILYDNPRTIVLSKDESSGEVKWNATFRDRMDFYGVAVRLCRYYRARTKGKVESGVKYVKRNGLAGRRFRDLEDLNQWLERWCVGVADERVHGTTHERPCERFASSEQAALIAVSARPPAVREEMVPRVVPRDGMVEVQSNRYEVPLSWMGQQVQVSVRAEEVVIVSPSSREEPLRHVRLQGKHGVSAIPGRLRSPKQVVRASAAAVPPQLDLEYLGAVTEVEARGLASYAEFEGVQG